MCSGGTRDAWGDSPFPPLLHRSLPLTIAPHTLSSLYGRGKCGARDTSNTPFTALSLGSNLHSHGWGACVEGCDGVCGTPPAPCAAPSPLHTWPPTQGSTQGSNLFISLLSWHGWARWVGVGLRQARRYATLRSHAPPYGPRLTHRYAHPFPFLPTQSGE